MIRPSVTVDQAIALLNEALKADPLAITVLIAGRVECNAQLADHPTIQCGAEARAFTVGPLGILNGLFGVDARGYGPISAVVDDGAVIRFERT